MGLDSKVPWSFGVNYGMEVLYMHGLAEIDTYRSKTRTWLATAGFGRLIR